MFQISTGYRKAQGSRSRLQFAKYTIFWRSPSLTCYHNARRTLLGAPDARTAAVRTETGKFGRPILKVKYQCVLIVLPLGIGLLSGPLIAFNCGAPERRLFDRTRERTLQENFAGIARTSPMFRQIRCCAFMRTYLCTVWACPISGIWDPNGAATGLDKQKQIVVQV